MEVEKLMGFDAQIADITDGNTEARDQEPEIRCESETLDIKHIGESGTNESIVTAGLDISQSKAKWNLLVLSVCFTLMFSAFSSFANIQSTINISGGLGTTGLAILYATMVVTNLFVTVVTLPKLRFKPMLMISMLCYVCYMATGYYSSWYTIVPGSIIIGFGASHLWPTQLAYVSELSKAYAAHTRMDEIKTLVLFNGVFFGIFYTSQVWGNLCLFIVFNGEADNENLINNSTQQSFYNNTTVTVHGRNPTPCGSEFCTSKLQGASPVTQPAMLQVYYFTTFCVGSGLLSVILLTVFLLNIRSTQTVTQKGPKHKVKQVTSMLFRSQKQHLLIASTVMTGMTQAFLSGDFTVAFVSCPYGIENVGLMMITYGVSMSVSAVVAGKISPQTGNIPVFCLVVSAAVCHIAALLCMLLWAPKPGEIYVVYILSAIWGVSDAINSTIGLSLYMVYFKAKRDAALSSYRMLSSVGWVVSFGYSAWMCTSVKLYILIAVVVVSYASVIVLEIKHRQ